eukprot:scaffold136590_cov34-Tisochrysis_lutea.AAC.3
MADSQKPPKVSQRAARKAAAACLARQRHKSFVNSLQETIEARKVRVGVLKRRKEDYFACIAAHMMRGVRSQLPLSRQAELQRWLLCSERLTRAWNEPPEDSLVLTTSEVTPTKAAAPSSSKPTPLPTPSTEPPASSRTKKAPVPKDTMKLDMALAQQVSLTLAIPSVCTTLMAPCARVFALVGPAPIL